MKRYIKSVTIEDILENPKYRELVDRIEELEEDIRGRGIRFDDDSEFLVRSYNRSVSDLEKATGYKWR